MISEAIETILNLAPWGEDGREAILEAPDKSGRMWLRNDGKGIYEAIEPKVVTQGHDVSNVESFAAVVIEETKRRGAERSDAEGPIRLVPHVGDFMTVIFGLTGATFSPDDRLKRDLFSFARTLSPQWVALHHALCKPMIHAEFVRLLQRLRPSIDNYGQVIRQFKKISFTDQTNIVSEPMLTDGANQNTYNVGVQVRAGGAGSPTTETTLPSEFGVTLQYARGSSKIYPMTIELDLSTIPKGERKELRFTLLAPDIQNVEEQAIEDEVAYFREMTKDIPRLLTIIDY